jgi:hypothetical protein
MATPPIATPVTQFPDLIFLSLTKQLVNVGSGNFNSTQFFQQDREGNGHCLPSCFLLTTALLIYEIVKYDISPIHVPTAT